MINLIAQHLCFAGTQMIYSHFSKVLDCTMRFAIYVPLIANKKKLPVLFWLSGLTCTEENFITKAGAQRVASSLGLILVVPDTSPRALQIPDENKNFDFGAGASFYLDATQEPWAKHYKMYSYLSQELPLLISSQFAADATRQGIFGHSMGGHGALSIALKNPHIYKSVSAFAPICSLMHCSWGEKALAGYLGDDKDLWKPYDVCDLIKQHGWAGPPILVDQGTADPFIEQQLKPHLLQQACEQNKVALELRQQEGYDHSYYFIATFIEDHLQYHAKNLLGLG